MMMTSRVFMNSDDPNTRGHATSRRSAAWVALLCGLLLLATSCGPRSTLPPALSDDGYWRLIEQVSEPEGTFPLSDNLVSNEPLFAESVRILRPGGGAYVGVGPEQNFSYIARLRPAIAFIVDIRRENRNLHLLYKALFEISADRADFISRLFSRPRPEGLGAGDSVDELFERFERVRPSADLQARTKALIDERLQAVRRLPLSPADLTWIDHALSAFFDDGPGIHFWGSTARVAGTRPEEQRATSSYRMLMTARDVTGQSRSYLASEDGFRYVKDMHARNLIVPVVGDFAGPTAIRRVGDYIRERADVVRAFYGSNVGVYLTNEQHRTFCRSLASLPASPGAWFIESKGVRTFASKLRSCPVERE
jgi:hypothetical protein